MIQISITYRCRVCGSTKIVKNGTHKCGHAQYYCQDCHAHRVLEPASRYTAQAQRTILDTYQERASLRGLGRIFGVARQTVLRWRKERVPRLPDLKDTRLPPGADEVRELDELGAFVCKKATKRGLWVALWRRTRQIVACVSRDRRAQTCRRLWHKIPAS